MKHYAYYEYIKFDGEDFFTVVLLPERDGCFPTVIRRSPYVEDLVNKTEDDVVQYHLHSYEPWLSRGYAIVFQHCRGQGKSTGNEAS